MMGGQRKGFDGNDPRDFNRNMQNENTTSSNDNTMIIAVACIIIAVIARKNLI